MILKSAITRIAEAFSAPSRDKAERAYLDQSVSLIDLESRQREIQRGKFNQF